MAMSLLPNAMKLRSSCYPNLKTLQVGDPQVALTLIHVCGSFCQFNYLTQAIPTPFLLLMLYIHLCLSWCTPLFHELYGNHHNWYFMVSNAAPSTFRWFWMLLPLPSCQCGIHYILFFIFAMLHMKAKHRPTCISAPPPPVPEIRYWDSHYPHW